MKKLTKVLIFALIVVMLFGTVYSSAAEPYDTYTYSIDGEPLRSPAAYSAIDDFDAIDMQISKLSSVGSLSTTVSDIISDDKGNIYIADSGNNRIVVLNQFYEAIGVISEYENERGQTLTLKNPKGLYITDPSKTADNSSFIYVCDTGNKRIVIFDRDFNYVRTIEKPESEILTDAAFEPSAIAVDIYGRIFVVSLSAYEGVIVLSGDGEFTGFIGAQEVSYSLIEIIWRRFQSEEVRNTQEINLANPYNNITVDDDGFVYVTTSASLIDDLKNQYAAIKTKASAYSPVKKLNSQGVEIMKRNGFFDPGGEVDVLGAADVSKIVDVAVGNQGSWTILDQSRSRFFTYDQNGNLLFAFGGMGDQLGHGANFVGMTYQIIEENGKDVYRLVALDIAGTGAKITVYDPTPYCDSIMLALENENLHNYSASQKDWEKVLTLNNNFDLAYIGIGKALYNQGKYEEAMEYLESAYETTMWSKANSASSKEFMSKWLLLVVAAVIVVVVLFVKFLGYAKKKNKETSIKVGKKTYWEELLFAFHLVFHPFDGFWDLKHEKRGSVRGASTIILITIASLFYQSIGKGYAFNPRGESNNLLVQILLLAIPLLLFCISNWCLTTLFDGEGSFKDIYIAAGYALAPLPLFVILSTILTNVVAIEAQGIVNLIVVIGYIWVGILLFFGMQVTHDYTMGKNFITILGTIVAMLVIAFIIVLFFSLIAKMVIFIISIFTEIGNRM